jgi:hypothetical protein
MTDKDDKDEKTIAEDLVVTKYKMAAEITQSKRTFYQSFHYKCCMNWEAYGD